MAKSRRRQLLRERLANVDGVHDTILDANNQSLLLLGGCARTHGCKELPHVNVLIILDGAGEDVRKRRLESAEQELEGLVPGGS